jgi:hypothetical protein
VREVVQVALLQEQRVGLAPASPHKMVTIQLTNEREKTNTRSVVFVEVRGFR